MNRFLIQALFSAVLACAALTAGAAAEVDRIVAIVNTEAVTLSQLRERVLSVQRNLQKQGEPMPPGDVLERQVLEQIVMERAQLQMARNASIRIDDAMIERAIGLVAENNRMNIEQLRAAVTREGATWNKFREDVRTELTLNRLREVEVDNKVTVSEAEVASFIKNHPEALSGREYRLAHILLRIPENATEAQMEALRVRAEKVLSRLRASEDFARIAADSSDASDNVRGGELGWRDRGRLPGFYAEVADKLKVGEISPPLRSATGLHIVKLLEKREKNGPGAQSVEQTHARHILLKTSELLSDAEAQARLNGLRERIANGADFVELARASSADLSAARGGDLGWLNPGDTVPEFEKAMNALAPNQISAPVRSPFGWHLIQVLGRRQQDMGAERLRDTARALLRQRKAEEAYDDWLRQVRDSAYVEYRLEESE